MEDTFVSWSDYADAADARQFGSAAELSQLNKALTAGSDINNPGAIAGNGFASRLESLEDSLKVLTFKAEHIKFWKMLTKRPAYNTVEEHNELQNYGRGVEGFLDEIDLPEEDDATVVRKYNRVKFMGLTRRVSHVATLTKSAYGNLIAATTEQGTIDLMRIVERALHYADSDLSDLQFDGLVKQLTSGNVIDMRGRALDEDVLRDGCETVSDDPNFGSPTHLFANPKVLGDFTKGFFPKGRYGLGEGPASVGMDIKKYTAATGDISLERNVFINDGGVVPSVAAGDPNRRPGTPTITTSATTPVDATGLFGAADAGNYRYKIVAMNDRGRSAPVDVGGAIAIAAGDKLTFGVTANVSTSPTKWYALYRTLVGGASGTERLIKRIPNTAGSTGVELTINDLNFDLPACSHAFLLQMDTDVLAWKQLAPFMKMPLGQLDNSIRWMQLLYGMLVVYQPRKCVLFKNVGRAEGYVGNV